MPGKHRNKTYATQYKLYSNIRAKKRAIDYLGGKCKICQYNKCVDALVVHHRDPNEKEFIWHDICDRTWDIVVGELSKCDLLCSNCHMEYHFPQRDFNLNNEDGTRNCPRCDTKFEPCCGNQIFCCKNCSTSYQSTYHRILLKARAALYKGGKCEACGYSKCQAALAFHHRDKTQKEFNISSRRNASEWSDILIELDKCDLLCFNCHAETHWDEEAHKIAEKAFYEAQKRILLPLPKIACGYCRKLFKPPRSRTIYCSKRCSYNDFNSHIEWPLDLSERVAKSSMNAVARELGVSGKSVRWRLISHCGYADDFKGRKIKNYPQDMIAYCNGRKVADVALEIGVSSHIFIRS